MVELPQILLVEHEQSVITQITAFIEKIGFCKPQVAGSQEEAKNIARYNRPDIALVDLALGNHNDGQTTAIMLSQDYNLPVIYLASRDDENERTGVNAPYGYVFKPVDRRNLKKTIMLALSRYNQLDNLSLFVADIPVPAIFVAVENMEVLIYNPAFSEMFPFIHRRDLLTNVQNSHSEFANELIQIIKQVPKEKNSVLKQSGFHTTAGDGNFIVYAKQMESIEQPVVLLSFVQINSPGADDFFNFSPVMQLHLDVKGNILQANQKWLEKNGYTRNEICQTALSSLLTEESGKIFEKEILGRLLSGETESNLPLELRRKDGEIAPYQSHLTILPERKSILAAFTESMTALDLLKEKEETTLANALRDTAAVLTSTLNFDEVLDRILVNVGEVVPNEAANVMMIWSGVAYIVRSIGYAERGLEESIMGLQIPITQESHFLSMFTTGLPLAVGDIQKYTALESYSGINWARSLASAPLRSKGQVFGFLNLESSQPGFYEQKHADRLQAFADQAAVAIENARLYAEVQQYAITDELTDIYNRRGLFELGRREVERARRYSRSLSAVMIDTDGFKTINDTYSHSVGDHVLRAMADRWKTSIREVDILGRYGGDEFVVLLPETELESAFQVADRLRFAICGKKIETPVGDISLSVSVGVAEIGDDTTTFDALIEKADQAMFLAKTSGKNQVRK